MQIWKSSQILCVHTCPVFMARLHMKINSLTEDKMQGKEVVH